jgi:hypothetical protein
MPTWKPGQSGNPAGRQRGSRNKLSEKFLAALLEDFEKSGAQAIAVARLEKPAEYLRTLATVTQREIFVSDDESDTKPLVIRRIILQGVRAGEPIPPEPADEEPTAH